MTRITVLVSGGGTNLQALIDAQREGTLHDGEISMVISSSPKAYALDRARQAGIPGIVVEPGSYPTHSDFDANLKPALDERRTDLVVLAGYISILGPEVLGAYKNRILNVHPSLLPAFSGKGMYGLKVHEAAIERGVKITGATVHLVNEVVDGGQIVLQKSVEVLPDDTPEVLQKRVMRDAEWYILPQAVAMFCRGEL